MSKFLISVAAIILPFFDLLANELKSGPDEQLELIGTSDLAMCKAPSASIENPTLITYFSGLLSTENWPARWTCGDWSQTEGWMYIFSDLSIFLAYLSIPIILLFYIRNRNIGKARSLIALFAVFILLCGFTHLIDVVLFWEPVYRLSGFVKLLTGLVSLSTAVVLGFVIPKALEYKSPGELQAEIDERKKIQNQFETFMKYSPGAIAMVDTELRYMMANPGWFKAYGVEEKNIIGKSHLDVFPQLREIPEWLDRYQRVLAGEQLSKDFDFYEVEGHTVYFRWKFEPWLNQDGSVGGIIFLTEILTEQVEIEKKLNESERRFTNIFNKAQLSIALVGDGGVPFLVNNQFCELLGYTEEELTSMNFKEFTHPDDVKKDVDRYDALIANKIDSYTIDKRYITKYGEVKYVKLNVTMVAEDDDKYALALVEDLTEAELAKSRNADMDRMMAEVSSVANIGSWEVDVKDNKCYWSDTVYCIHEEDPTKEIALEDGINYYHPDHREIISKAVNDGIVNQEPWDLELKIITAKGNEKWTRAIGRAVFENNEVTKLQGLFQDIDKKKRYELEIEKSNKGLEEKVNDRTIALEKANEALEAFSYSVSHDLRAPLRAIGGYSEALIVDYSDKIPSDANKYLSRISANSEKMGRLIDDLLEFSRMNRKKINYQQVDLNELVSQLIGDLFHDSEKNITVNELPEITGDKEMLAQVFANLISNSVKYSSKQENPKVFISFKENATSYVISVQDNGVGFDMEYYDKLFKVFQRLHSEEEFEGTGVGLSLCAKIMNAHDGEIWAESKKGEGATFYLRFKKDVKNGTHQ